MTILNRDRRIVAEYEAASRLLSLIPGSVSLGVANVVGLIAFMCSPRKRQLVRDNVLRATEGRAESFGGYLLTLRAYLSYSRYWVEALALGRMTRKELNSRMGFHGFQHVYAALGKGKGAIFATPHMGNWDFGAAWLASSGIPITAVMEELEPKELLEWFASHRTGFGVRAVPASSSAFGELARALSKNQVVALVADRDVSNHGLMVPFFGEKASVPQGVALLSLRTGAPIIPAAVYLLPGGCHYALVRDPITFVRSGDLKNDVLKLTELIVASFESLIRADPSQWHLFQPNWPSQIGDASPDSTI